MRIIAASVLGPAGAWQPPDSFSDIARIVWNAAASSDNLALTVFSLTHPVGSLV